MDDLKVVLYTANIDNYDKYVECPFMSLMVLGELKKIGVDVVFFTDDRTIVSTELYEVRYVDIKYSDSYRTAREIKIRPDLYLPNYDISIWVDSSVILTNTTFIVSQIFSALKDANMAFQTSPYRTCTYEEEKAVLRYKKDVKHITSRQMKKYMRADFPKGYGMFQTNILYRRHNERDCINFCDLWLREVLSHSHRDQLSCMYILWRTGTKVNVINFEDLSVGYNVRNFHGPARNMKTKNKMVIISAYLNNLDITCWAKNKVLSVGSKFLHIDESLRDILKVLNISAPENSRYMFVFSFKIANKHMPVKTFECGIDDRVVVTLDTRLNDLTTETNYFGKIKTAVYKSFRHKKDVSSSMSDITFSETSNIKKKLLSTRASNHFRDIDIGYPKQLKIKYDTGLVLSAQEYSDKFISVDIRHSVKSLPKVGVVITTHGNKWNICKNALEGFREYLANYKNFIIVYDNESTDLFWTPHIQTFYPGVEYSRSEDQVKSGGLTGTWNRGIKRCIEEGCDIIILSNNDIIVNPSLITFIKQIQLEKNNNILAVYGPMSNIPGPPNCNMKQKTSANTFKEFNEMKKSTNNTESITLERSDNINGFFMGFHKDTAIANKFDNEHFFDPSKPFGGNEVEWFRRLQTKGGIGKVLTNCFVYHSKEQSWRNIGTSVRLCDIYKPLKPKHT